MPSLDDLKRTEWSPRFEELMRNRLVMGAFRYGKLKGGGKVSYDQLSAMKKRLQDYEETGNTENLIDVANLALIEFELGNHPNKHWSPTDDSEHCKEV